MKLRWFLWLGLLGLVALLVLTWPGQKIRLVFCDVGQGDGAVLVKGDFQMVFDTGPDNGKMVECLDRQMAFWDKRLEVIVLSHMDSDHSGGLKSLEKYFQIEKLYTNEQNNYSEKLNSSDMLRSDWFTFEVVSSGEGATDNDKSVVGILKVNQKQVLFTGDAGMEVEQRLVWRKKIVDDRSSVVERILKVSHHGSKTGTSQELLAAFRPKVAVISVGKNNRYGHPSSEVIKRLEENGVEIWRTDEMGEIKFDL